MESIVTKLIAEINEEITLENIEDITYDMKQYLN